MIPTPYLLALLLPALTFWLFALAVQIHTGRLVCYLKDAVVPPLPRPPRLVVVMPALNEARDLRSALDSLLAQDYPDLRVVAVDDRSGDATGTVMDTVAAEDPRVSVIHVRQLPEGWLGKNHANWLGWQRARELGGDWILFTDGDVQFSGPALSAAMSTCLESGLDHLAVFPELVQGGFWQSAFNTAFAVWFGLRFLPQLAGRPRSNRFVGVGAFNLVRRAAYEAVGTHEVLRLTVADDMALGKLLQRAGFRQAILWGNDRVRVRWNESLGGAIRGLYKNTFASMRFRWDLTLACALGLLYLSVLPWLALPLAAGWNKALAVVTVTAICLVFGKAARGMGHGPAYSLALALGSGISGLLFIWLLLASAAITQRQGGVNWRGTLYPTELLRGSQVDV